MLSSNSSLINKKFTQEFDIASRNLNSMYFNFYSCLERLLTEASLSRRHERIYWKIRYHEKLTERELLFSKKCNEKCKYITLDYENFILHTKIYFDGMAYITKFFFNFEKKPSNKSFSEHRKFFLRDENIPYYDEVYASKIRNDLAWWDIFIKFIRDKLIIHRTMKHLKSITYQGAGDNIAILYFPFIRRGEHQKDVDYLQKKYTKAIGANLKKSGYFSPLDFLYEKMNGKDRNLFEKIRTDDVIITLDLKIYIEKIIDWLKFYNEHFKNYLSN